MARPEPGTGQANRNHEHGCSFVCANALLLDLGHFRFGPTRGQPDHGEPLTVRVRTPLSFAIAVSTASAFALAA